MNEEQQTLVRRPTDALTEIDKSERPEDRLLSFLVKLGVVAGFLALEIIVLLAVAEALGVR